MRGTTRQSGNIRAGLVDEIYLAIFPAIGAPSVFHSRDGKAAMPAPIGRIMIESSEVFDGALCGCGVGGIGER